MAEETKKADTERPWRTAETPNLQKSENPDAAYLKDRNLCSLCHGIARICERGDCPGRSAV